MKIISRDDYHLMVSDDWDGHRASRVMWQRQTQGYGLWHYNNVSKEPQSVAPVAYVSKELAEKWVKGADKPAPH